MNSQSFQTYQHNISDAFVTLMSAQSQALRDIATLNAGVFNKLPSPDISNYNATLQSVAQQTLEAQKKFGQQHVTALKEYGTEIVAQVKDTFSSDGMQDIVQKSKSAFGFEDAIIKPAAITSKR